MRASHMLALVAAAMADGTYPVRGVVAHNYPVDLHTLQMWGFKTVPRMSQAYLTYPEGENMQPSAPGGAAD